MLALRLLLRWVWQAGLLAAVGLATGYIAVFDQRLLLHWLWLAPSAQWTAHLLMRLSAPGLSRLQGPPRPAVVVGSNAQGEMLARRITESPYEGIGLLGVFDDRRAGRDGVAQPLAFSTRWAVTISSFERCWPSSTLRRMASGNSSRKNLRHSSRKASSSGVKLRSMAVAP